MTTPEEFFSGSKPGLAVYRAVANMVDDLGGAEVRVGRSQVSFRRRRGFAYVWRPGQYVRSDVPVVLSIALPHKLSSSRLKEVAHPAAHTWMHHLELAGPDGVDAEVRGWVTEAYEAAGPS